MTLTAMVGAALASDTTFFPFLYHTREYTYFEWYHVGGASIPRQWHGGPEMGSHVTPSPEEEEEEEEQDKEERSEGRKEGGTGTALARPPTAGPPPRP